jgi:hypothetical protein
LKLKIQGMSSIDPLAKPVKRYKSSQEHAAAAPEAALGPFSFA